MARTQLVAQALTDAGVALALTPANVDGHWINPGDNLLVRNTNGATRTVTIQTGATLEGKAVADQPVIIPATTGEIFIGDLTASPYEQPSGADQGRILVDFSAVTGLTIAAFR